MNLLLSLVSTVCGVLVGGYILNEYLEWYYWFAPLFLCVMSIYYANKFDEQLKKR